MSDFPTILKSKIDEKGLNLTDAAAAIGVSLPSLRTALAGSSFPNSRSLSKYAGFIGLGSDETKALIDAAKAGAAPKAKGKPGRKPGRKPKAETAGKPGRKPGRKAKAGGAVSGALATIAAALKQSEALASDPLAVAVSKLGGPQRKIIESLVKSLS